jgi:tryptophan-rich sensory protein
MGEATVALRTLPERRPLVTLALAVLACELVGASGAVFTASGLERWYGTLRKPALAPPNLVFGPVWTTLFALMGAAAWLVWRELPGPNAAAARRALWVFAGHFVLNVGWSAAFFGARSIGAGLVVIVALWFAILATIWTFDRVDRRAAGLLVPYLLWVTFAAYLNYAFWVLN